MNKTKPFYIASGVAALITAGTVIDYQLHKEQPKNAWMNKIIQVDDLKNTAYGIGGISGLVALISFSTVAFGLTEEQKKKGSIYAPGEVASKEQEAYKKNKMILRKNHLDSEQNLLMQNYKR